KRPSAASRHIQDEEKRKNFLERNRQAALKCRQRKKEWLQNLQTRVEYLTVDNEQLQLQTSSLREELLNLKTILLAHKDCPIGQEAMLKLIHRPIPGLSAMGQITPPSTASPQHESDHPASAPEN
ncbi:uncharacterized protein BYT42DRAFT_500142, partial [Radiomyces spectabilis]|uniref:uncharacterized protein n=1 Tax=Radiomyces spectabilis TaxID=64574 RepID=UPI00221F5EC9